VNQHNGGHAAETGKNAKGKRCAPKPRQSMVWQQLPQSRHFAAGGLGASSRGKVIDHVCNWRSGLPSRYAGCMTGCAAPLRGRAEWAVLPRADAAIRNYQVMRSH